MSWLVLALIGHLSNGAAFLIDKMLLTSAWKRSATYAAMIGGLSLVTIVAAPWVTHWPEFRLLPVVIPFGALFVFGLWGFFEALKRSEATRVVPIVGSLIPIITLLGTSVFFGERLTWTHLAGFILLLSATWLLTGGSLESRLPSAVRWLCVGSAMLFAGSTVLGKYAFDHGDFLGVFISSRLAAGVTGVLIGLMIPSAGKEIVRAFTGKKSTSTPKHAVRHAQAWTILGQTLGAFGFVFVHLAIRSGSAALVNALQAVQYAFLVITALLFQKYAPQLLGERLDRPTILRKACALVVTAAGLALVA